MRRPFFPTSIFYQQPDNKTFKKHCNNFSKLFSLGSFVALKCRHYTSVLSELEEQICSHSHPRKCLSLDARAFLRGAKVMGDHRTPMSEACQHRPSAGETETPYNMESSNSHSKRATSHHVFLWPARTDDQGKLNVPALSLDS